ncbi:hypothetical protein ACQ4PT_046358 [Festuca glaucescens]
MDDLKVAPMSTISGITLLNTFGITDIGSLQEKTVQLGYPERPDPFKLLLTETNIGLNSSEIKMTSTERGSTASKLSMKLLVNSKSHRVLYAEAGKDVVDFLFSLLTLPLAGRRGQHHGRSYVTMVDGTLCPYCGAKMSTPAQLVQPSASAAVSSRAAGAGFVQGVAYTVMDDLKVAPMSTISGITLLNTFGITDIGSLQEKTVQLGYPEGLEMMKASLQSKTVLTDVFLGKKGKARRT